LTIDEAAQQLRVESADIAALIECGRLRAIRIGEMIRIPEKELEELIVRSPAGPVQDERSSSTETHSDSSGFRAMPTRSGRATFKVRGSVGSEVEILPGNMRYPIRFPRAFWDKLLAYYAGKEIAVGGSFDGPHEGSLGEFIQTEIKTKMNPAVYIAALLIADGYAEESRRGYINIKVRKN
jgi:excisionase family DNA binding protein